MIRKVDPNERLILELPAVRPCESISSTVLISSLISLSHNISKLQSQTFPTQKKITREAFRQVGILLIFFQEIRENYLSFSNSLILSLSELHFALQKILFLLQDFTRQGSRLYILMKSQFIVHQFRVLVRSIAGSLDIVQFDSLEISSEVKELLELLANQARKLKPQTDPNDEWAMERVTFMLNQFENELEPERVSIKWILDYLGIKNWADCNSEVVFLENQMNNIEDDERESCVTSNLLGFMCYCRVVVFDTLLDTNDEQMIVPSSLKRVTDFLNPEDFRCPISLELMMDPVTISTGQTYDRVSIRKWLSAGHLLCPKTGEKLTSTELVPNSTLKKLIQNFCSENGVSILLTGNKKTVLPPGPVAKEAIRFLSQFLAGRLAYGANEQKNKAAYEIRLLTKSSVFNRIVLIEVGNVAPLLDLLTSDDANTQENAIAALLKLAKHSKGQRAIIEEGGLMLVIFVLRHGIKNESKQIAAATLFYLSSVEKYRKLIGSTREAIPGLIELIKNGTVTGKKNAMAAIFGLLLYHGNHKIALESGIVSEIIGFISSVQRSELLSDALAILASLADKSDGSVTIVKTSALSLIIGLIKSSISRGGKECCVSILLSLCKNVGNEVVAALAKEAAIMPCIYSVVADGSCHGSKKARALIGMLQGFQESSSSRLTGGIAVRKERFVNLV